jgi:hypothetical protein
MASIPIPAGIAQTRIHWDNTALAYGQLQRIGASVLPQVATDVANRAIEYSGAYHLWRHTGELTRSIGWDLGHDTIGYYADVSSSWYGRFLDPKASQLHFLRPLLPSSLEVINGKTYS